MSTQEESVKVFKPSQFFITAMIIKNKKQKTNKKTQTNNKKKTIMTFATTVMGISFCNSLLDLGDF